MPGLKRKSAVNALLAQDVKKVARVDPLLAEEMKLHFIWETSGLFVRADVAHDHELDIDQLVLTLYLRDPSKQKQKGIEIWNVRIYDPKQASLKDWTAFCEKTITKLVFRKHDGCSEIENGEFVRFKLASFGDGGDAETLCCVPFGMLVEPLQTAISKIFTPK